MIEAVLACLFGLLIGSFLNVCIYRWPRDLSVLQPARSFCGSCEASIAWYDNLPLLSYAILGGKCRQCGARIPLRYPLVELLTGLLFFYSVYRFGPTALGLKLCVFCAMQVILIFSDLEERILPDEITKGGTLVGILFAWFVPVQGLIRFFLPEGTSPQWISVSESVLGAALPAAMLWLTGYLYEKIRKREGLGLGDVKMLAMIGAFFGLQGTLLTLLLGSLLGSVIGLLYILVRRKDASSYELPFGTFLGAAAIVIAFTAAVPVAAP